MIVVIRIQKVIRFVLLLLCTNAATTATHAFAVPPASHQSLFRAGHDRDLRILMRTQKVTSGLQSSTLGQAISQLSNPASAFTQLSSSAQSTPVIAYFLVLCAAGFGLPVSEDLLCVFARTMLVVANESVSKGIALLSRLELLLDWFQMVGFTCIVCQ